MYGLLCLNLNGLRLFSPSYKLKKGVETTLDDYDMHLSDATLWTVFATLYMGLYVVCFIRTGLIFLKLVKGFEKN